MNDKQFNKWSIIRSKGKFKYFLVNGVLFFGLVMFFFMALIQNTFTDGLTSQAAMTHYITWPLAGLFFGVSTWYFSEYQYKKERAKRS